MIVNRDETRIIGSYDRYGRLNLYDVDGWRDHSISIGDESIYLVVEEGAEDLVVVAELSNATYTARFFEQL